MADPWETSAGVMVVLGWLIASVGAGVHVMGLVAGWWGWGSDALLVTFSGVLLMNAGALGLKRTA